MPRLRKTDAWMLAGATTLAMTLSYVDRQAFSLLAPRITEVFHLSDAAYGRLASAFSIAYLAGGPIAGLFIDRVGARRGLLGAVLVWSVVAAAHAVAPGVGALIAVRLALGLAESPTFPAGVQVVQRALPPVDRPRGMSLLFAGMSLGSTLAGPVAIGLAVHFGWRFAFLGTAALAAAWAPLWLVATRRGPARVALDDPGERSERAPMMQVLVHPAMLRGLVGLLAIVPASAFAMAWEAKYYVRQFGMPLGDLRTYVVASALAYDVGAILFGDLASRRQRARADGSPPRLLLGAGACLAVVGLGGLAVAATPHGALGFFLASAAGRGAVVTLCNTDAIARLPQRSVAAAGGIIASVQSLGAIVTNPLLGSAVGGSGGYRQALFALAAWTVPGTLAWLLWQPPRLQAGEAEVPARAPASRA